MFETFILWFVKGKIFGVISLRKGIQKNFKINLTKQKDHNNDLSLFNCVDK